MIPYDCKKLSNALLDLHFYTLEMMNSGFKRGDAEAVFGSKRHIEAIFRTIPFVVKRELEKRVRTLIVGGKSASELREMFEQKGMKIYEDKHCKLEKISLSPEEKPVKVILLRVRELGFDKAPSKEEFDSRIWQLGLKPCSVETVIYQRLTDTIQPVGDRYTVYMNPLKLKLDMTGKNDFNYEYFLESRSDGRWLDTSLVSGIWHDLDNLVLFGM